MIDPYHHENVVNAVVSTEEGYCGTPFNYIRFFLAIINQAIQDLDAEESLHRRKADLWLFTPSTEEFSLHYLLKHIGMLHQIEHVRQRARNRNQLEL